MMKVTALLLACVGVVSSVGSEAAESSVIGAGAGTCGTWLAERARNNQSENFSLSWAQGYLSGINIMIFSAAKRPMLELPNVDVIAPMLDNECRSAPDQMIAEGLLLVWKKLSNRAQRNASGS